MDSKEGDVVSCVPPQHTHISDCLASPRRPTVIIPTVHPRLSLLVSPRSSCRGQEMPPLEGVVHCGGLSCLQRGGRDNAVMTCRPSWACAESEALYWTLERMRLWCKGAVRHLRTHLKDTAAFASPCLVLFLLVPLSFLYFVSDLFLSFLLLLPFFHLLFISFIFYPLCSCSSLFSLPLLSFLYLLTIPSSLSSSSHFLPPVLVSFLTPPSLSLFLFPLIFRLSLHLSSPPLLLRC